MSKPTAEELEKYIVPDVAMKAFMCGMEENIPTALVHHPKYGWYVIQTSGQGPYIIWTDGVEDERRENSEAH